MNLATILSNALAPSASENAMAFKLIHLARRRTINIVTDATAIKAALALALPSIGVSSNDVNAQVTVVYNTAVLWYNRTLAWKS